MSEGRKYRQVSANEKCPCGSGKKYIDCCLDSNVRWVVDEDGVLVRLNNIGATSARSNDDILIEEFPLLRIDVSNGKITYSKNNKISRLSCFPPDVLKMMLSVIEIEKTQAMVEAVLKKQREEEFPVDRGDFDTDSIQDGTYILLMVAVDSETGNPTGIGGSRVSGMLSESSVLRLVGALEEIKTDILLCLTINAVMNGMIGVMDYDDK